MRVLGIETSCDETGLAVYDTTRGLLSTALHSQVAMHADYGGVVPELASRDHVHRLLGLADQVLVQANTKPAELDAIAFTQGPGLVGALMVGASMAAGLAYSWKKPAIGVHHLEGHLMSPLLSNKPPQFPFVALLCSGGHTQLYEVSRFGHYQLLGETVDDAAGEAFDKSAKLLGLGYPGGPALSQLASTAKPGEAAPALPRPKLYSADLDFSFSGLKTAVANVIFKQQPAALQPTWKAALAAEIERAIVEVLVAKSIKALKHTGLKQLVVSGGVSANQHLRRELLALTDSMGVAVFFPELALCTDNGAMIALAGAMRLAHGSQASSSFGVKPRWPLQDLPSPSIAGLAPSHQAW
jgi:N6-L-threonylcarbamoyladenine synthase